MTTSWKRALATAGSLGMIACAAWYTWANVSSPSTPPDTRVFIDQQTGERFNIKLTEDLKPFPLTNPRTGEPTLWPAEFCMSSTCAPKGGTPVILNTYLGKSEPTHCPVCGAEVRLHNSSRDEARSP